MTQPPRTTESLNRDNEAIRDIMNQIRDRLTVPDRATLALGLVGHLATMMNSRQIEKLMGELHEQAERVQDVPPARRADRPEGRSGATAAAAEPGVGQAGRGRGDGGRGEDVVGYGRIERTNRTDEPERTNRNGRTSGTNLRDEPD